MIAAQQLETYILLSNIRAQYLVHLEFALKGIIPALPSKEIRNPILFAVQSHRPLL